MKKLYFITSNKGKFKETKESFSDLNINIVQRDLGYPEIQADSLEEVAFFGIDYLENKINQPFILEDAGLFIDIFDGFPGVYSKYVFYKIGCLGILKLLEDFEQEKRKAVFKSVYAYSEPNKKPLFFIGKCHGRISKKIVGQHGFGYDPIFIPKEDTKTFGQMNTNEKNKYSHRGKSLEKLKNFLKNR